LLRRGVLGEQPLSRCFLHCIIIRVQADFYIAFNRLVSVAFVVLGIVFNGLFYGATTSRQVNWIIPVEAVTIGWFILVSRMPIVNLNVQARAKKLVYMEFLCLWSTISAALCSELLLVSNQDE
jgi:hypothetical protein